jgi:hypothetical protein
MKSIKQHINELNQSDWDYYYDFSSVVLTNPFDNHVTHSDFIKSYFKRSGKSIVLDLIDITDNEIFKAEHTNSIFFLGILLFKNTEIDKEYFKDYNSDSYKEFPFIWFLTCLFHDFGMKQESSKELLSNIIDIETLKKNYKIRYCFLEKNISGIDKLLFNHIRQYFLYRRLHHKKIDHGILAGLYFYDRLVKNRILKQKKNTDGLFWGKELEKQYALVASAISIHNMWFPNDKSACEYIKFEMKGLINAKPISLKKSPLLYLLGIVDTIDPIKIFGDKHSVDEIIENLNIEFNTNELIIENNETSSLDFKYIIDKSENFKDWLDVDLIKEKDRLTIKMK